MKPEFFPSDQIKEGVRYHAITLLGDDDGQIWHVADTSLVDFDPDDDPRFELRGLGEIYADKMAAIWQELRQPYQVVNTSQDFVTWYVTGGHGIISREMIERHMPKQLKTRRCVREGFLGYTSAEVLPKTALQKAPTPKLRMKVMTRDQRRCLICGQRPADDPNIVLHAHHIRPFGQGGVTTEKNLITLCHTCHAGLDPHSDFTLYGLISESKASDESSLNRELRKYINGILAYRKAMAPQVEELRARVKKTL